MDIKMGLVRLEPLIRCVKYGLVSESITMQHSGRVIDNQRIPAGTVVFWPENK